MARTKPSGRRSRSGKQRAGGTPARGQARSAKRKIKSEPKPKTPKPAAKSASAKPAARGKSPPARAGKVKPVASRPRRGPAGPVKPVVVRPDVGPAIVDPALRLNLHIDVLRRDDFLALRFELVNLRLRATPAPARLVRIRPLDAAFIILHLPPQNIAEQAFFETATGPQKIDVPASDPDKSSGAETPLAPPVKSRIAAASRLVFRVATGVAEIAYTLEALLERCTTDALELAPTALPPPPELVIRRPLVFAKTDFISIAKLGKVLKAPKAGAGRPRRARLTTAAADALTARKLFTGYRARILDRLGLAEVEGVTLKPGIVDDIRIKPKLVEPTARQTAIELPFRLIVSPHRGTGFLHASGPVTSARSGRTELWHTRLGARRADGSVVDDTLRGGIRAIWARSGTVERGDGMEKFYPEQRTLSGGAKTWAHPGHATSPHEPFRSSLDAFDRHNVVHLSANWHIQGFNPRPLDVDRLMLTALGGWFDSRGAWTPPTGLSVEEWRHRAAMGRDHYVRVVYAGFLLPFGNRASLVKITERKFHNELAGNPAYMRQRMFIVVGEPTRTFRNTGFVVDDLHDPAWTDIQLDHQMPLARITITSRVTPNLDKPENSELIAGKSQSLFWPCVAGAPFPFHVVGEDLVGQRVEFTLPMVFVEKPMIDDKFSTAPMGVTVTQVMKAYDAPATEARRTAASGGARIAYALPSTPGDTSFETRTLLFGVQLPRAADYDKLPGNQARFYPVLRRKRLALSAAKQFLGRDDAPEFRYPLRFLRAPLSATGAPADNAGEMFLEIIKGQEIKLDFGAGGGDKSGGLTKPNIAISGVSRRLGPVGGQQAIDKIGTGQFDPKDFFATLADSIPAKLFGVIDLWDVIAALGLDDDIAAIPKLLSEELSAVEGFVNDLLALKARLDAVVAAGGAAAAAATQLQSSLQQVFDNIGAGALAALGGAGPGSIAQLATDLGALLAQLPGAGGLSDAVRQEVQRRLGQVQSVVDKAADLLADIQRFVDAVEMAKEGRVKFEWKPRLVNWPSSKPLFVASRDGKPGYFVIAAEIRSKTDGKSEPSIDVLCGLENFTLDLIAPAASFIKLKFQHIRFVVKPGRKAEVDVVLADIEFVGVLSFVEVLKDFIPLDGFSDPPALTVDERGIDASFSLPLPNITCGVFALTNLSLGAGFTVPFIGEPLSVRFFFCERDKPFTLQVWLFGGGGFFGITLDPGGVQVLEASFEFGASVSIDFGVASGGIQVMAGIYFRMEKDEASLTGYFRLYGEVDVLGLISASLELYLSLSYEFSSGKAVGRASLTIEVSVLCFSGSVEISCERKFAGSNGDPTFVQMLGPDPAAADSPWREYCEAFA